MAAAVKEIPSALFVDFDNVFLGLQQTDAAAAQEFATNPRVWLAALEAGGVRDGLAFRRRFLVRTCYLNPSSFARFRGDFARAGFRVVDTPSLTRQGKSGADIQMALDVVDAISHPTNYEEFVICSADADFTPLMVRLRAHGRRTVMVAAGPASSAYEAVCDDVLGASELADAALGPTAGKRTHQAGSTPVLEPAELAPSADASVALQLSEALKVIRSLGAQADEPVPGATAAHVARGVAPDLAAGKWGGEGFLAFCERELSGEMTVLRRDSGLLTDPRRHKIPIPEEDGVLARVRRLTGAPRLSSSQLRVLFEALAADLATTPFSLSVTSRRVRDATAEMGEPLGRSGIGFVLQGIAFRSPQSLSGAGASSRDLAEIWRDNVIDHCSTVGLELSADDVGLVDAWVLGAFSD